MSEIPYGYCHCGCGKKTEISKFNSRTRGYVKGEPKMFLLGHRKMNLPTIEPNPSGICMCGCGLPAPIAYKNLTRLGWMKGKPARYIRGHNSGSGADRIKEFFRLANKTDDNSCWLWSGIFDRDGYGVFSANGGSIKAHRFSYLTFNGELIKGMEIRHTCDNPPCVNPNHLVQGTRLDNARDMKERGRSLAGEKHPLSKLLESDVVNIRKEYSGGRGEIKKLALKYSVSSSTISAIVSGRLWKHLI